jgi:hypothetical protein
MMYAKMKQACQSSFTASGLNLNEIEACLSLSVNMERRNKREIGLQEIIVLGMNFECSPSNLLKDPWHHLEAHKPRGAILDLACGRGQNGPFLLEMDFR